MSHVKSSISTPHANPSLVQVQNQLHALGLLDLGLVSLKEGLLDAELERLYQWLGQEKQGDMRYMARSPDQRADPSHLLHGAQTALVVGLPYLPQAGPQWRADEEHALEDPRRAVVSVYARGRDYHKVLRARLGRLAEFMAKAWQRPVTDFRACVDSAPLMEVALAAKAQRGWQGKNTLLLTRAQGSMIFLGVLLTRLSGEQLRGGRSKEPVHAEQSPAGHCGSCTDCLTACPTQAFVGPYQLDARRCISYLTIEHEGDIEESLRPLMGNRVYGCDDCQRVCPWNRFAQKATLPDFAARHGLDAANLADLFGWTEDEFNDRHQGSAIRRIGHARWLRNLAVGLGNALRQPLSNLDRRAILQALQARRGHCTDMVNRHIEWALAQDQKAEQGGNPSPLRPNAQ